VISPDVKTSYDHRQAASVAAQAFREKWRIEQDVSKDSSYNLLDELRSILQDKTGQKHRQSCVQLHFR